MNSTYDIPVYALIFIVCLLAIPMYLLKHLNLRKQMKMLVISASRMVIQLILIGMYLGYLFKLDNIFVNFAWILVMMTIANITILQRNGIKVRLFFPSTIGAYLITISLLICVFAVVITPERVAEAKYIIPLGGMILGNTMNSNTIGFDRFYRELNRRQHEYVHYILLGATQKEATKPFLREAYKAAITPHLNSLATVGLVSLPGMMTGQILGGSPPNTAIRYQIMIMLALFLTSTVSNFLALNFSMKASFDKSGRLKNIYIDQKDKKK